MPSSLLQCVYYLRVYWISLIVHMICHGTEAIIFLHYGKCIWLHAVGWATASMVTKQQTLVHATLLNLGSSAQLHFSFKYVLIYHYLRPHLLLLQLILTVFPFKLPSSVPLLWLARKNLCVRPRQTLLLPQILIRVDTQAHQWINHR